MTEMVGTDAIAVTQEVELAASTKDAPEVLSWDSRARRTITIYIPLAIFVLVLLFPFYWMAITSIKPDFEMYDYKQYNPFWVHSPTLDNIRKLLFETEYPRWLMTTMGIATAATFLSVGASVLAAYAIERLRFKGAQHVGLAIYLAYLVPPTILFIPLATLVFQFGMFDSPIALILTYPTFLIPFCTWLLIGYFKSIPYELEECALIDGASRLQILRRITLPLAVPGLISAGIFAFTLSWNEFIYALAFIQSTEKKTVPVAILTELVTGDVYQWGSLMAGSLLGSVPVAIIYFLRGVLCVVDDRRGEGVAGARGPDRHGRVEHSEAIHCRISGRGDTSAALCSAVLLRRDQLVVLSAAQGGDLCALGCQRSGGFSFCGESAA